ncbi:hypothetical protein M2137_001719 [Parabacteroides sp. PFB2-10]|uniref:hypothetical protein n=1 Tax=Parabacteroides sp. PFB2-10 TaxID=1742405 RepID=UPI002476D689|nr:hypothetical protein [Parabacteroides sp. PFB2-10]MDH6312934.1 hypothetical protein [Parabacteroides sp. PFB2-10]
MQTKESIHTQSWRETICDGGVWSLSRLFDERKHHRTFYPGRPVIMASTGWSDGRIGRFTDDATGREMIRLQDESGETYVIAAALYRTNIVEQTFKKLIESLKDDGEDPVNRYIHEEYALYQQDARHYGLEVLFFDEVGEGDGHFRPRVLIKLPSIPIWKLAITLSNGHLINNRKQTFDWYHIRLNIFNHQHITVAGASVASQAALYTTRLIKPFLLTLADPKGPNASNLNRTQYTLFDLLEDPDTHQEVSKAIALARSIHGQDPFQLIHIYPEGITEENLEAFLLGESDKVGTTPRTSLLIEAIDHFPTKRLLLEKARDWDIPTIQLADVGSRGINGFNSPGDKKRKIRLLYGLSDKEVAKAFADPSPETFMQTAMLASGITNTLAEPVAFKFLKQQDGNPFRSVPQTGEVAGASGVMAARNAARFVVEQYEDPAARFDGRQQVFDVRTGKGIRRYRNSWINEILNRVIKRIFRKKSLT